MGRRRLKAVGPEPIHEIDPRWLVRHIPEWMFVVWHPCPEQDPLFYFSIFPEKARRGIPGWLIPGLVGWHDVAYLDLIQAFVFLVDMDKREMLPSRYPELYSRTLVRKIGARIDALQQYVEIQTRTVTVPRI